MKILEYIEQGNRVIVSALYDDNTFATLNMLNADDKESILKDVYIISSDVRNRQPFEGEIPQNAEEWTPPKAIATKLTVTDWNGLKGKVYDQYGDLMQTDIEFTIEGTDKARIENGTIIEDVVDTDTSYFIVAKYGNLEERQERTIYAPVEPRPSKIELLNKKVERLASENEAKDDLLQEIILQMYQ